LIEHKKERGCPKDLLRFATGIRYSEIRQIQKQGHVHTELAQHYIALQLLNLVMGTKRLKHSSTPQLSTIG